MKNSNFYALIIVLVLMSGNLLAQAPQYFKYQAVIRDAGGQPIDSQTVGIQISILKGSADGPAVYTETHSIETNPYGMVNLAIGSGTVENGMFTAINWGSSNYYVSIEVDENGGTDYQVMGTSQLLAVPYALYAETSGNGSGSRSDDDWISGNGYTTVTGANDNVGIGLINPSKKLEVFDDVNAGHAIFVNNPNTGTNSRTQLFLTNGSVDVLLAAANTFGAAFFGTMTNHAIRLTTNNSVKMTITPTGNVGIGTNNPLRRLEVYQNIDDWHAIFVNNPNTGHDSRTQMYLTNGNVEVLLSAVNRFGAAFFGTMSNHDIRFTTNDAVKMIVNTSGNVGIGTITPGYRLDVNGTVNATQYYKNGVPLVMGPTGPTGPTGPVSDLWTENGPYVYLTELSDNVGIGTSTPAYPLSVVQSSSAFIQAKSDSHFAGLVIDKGDPDDNGYVIYRQGGEDKWFAGMIDNNNYAISTSYNTPDGKFFIDTNGMVGIGTSTPSRTLEISGDWPTARLSTSSSGPFLEFAGSYSTDWGIGVWSNVLRIVSTVDTFNIITDEFLFSTSAFRPFYNDDKTLGTSSQIWSNVYSKDGDFSGAVNVEGHLTGNQSTLGGLQVHDDVNELSSLYITPQDAVSGDSARIFLAEDDEAYYGMYWMYDGGGNQMELWGKSGSNEYGPHLLIERTNGRMIIGGTTAATNYEVSIHGDLICEEVRVAEVADWPDYVFKENYDLMAIPALSKYIDKNGHLPNVPPAQEIEDSGFEVGEMQKVMIRKIEELSLYIIEQDKKLDAQTQLNTEQQKEIEALKSQINKSRK